MFMRRRTQEAGGWTDLEKGEHAGESDVMLEMMGEIERERDGQRCLD